MGRAGRRGVSCGVGMGRWRDRSGKVWEGIRGDG